MRRLNQVCEILSDPERRHVYDASLARTPAPANHWKAPRLRGDLWTLAAIAAVLAIGSYGIGVGDHEEEERESASPAPAVAEVSRPTPRPQAERRPPATSLKPDAEDRVAQLRSQVEALRAERDEAVARAARAPHEAPALPSVQVESKPAVAAVPAAAEPAAQAEPRGFAGTWYYPQPAEAAPSALYPPEFIEVTIVETGGAVQGRYRARYRVPNRALSPDVAFRFEGRRGESSAEVPWRSPGGASGELRLRLIPDGRMEAAWSAAALGELGLSAGTAVLVRKR